MENQNKLLAAIFGGLVCAAIVIVIGNRFLMPQMIVKPDPGELPVEATEPRTLGKEAATIDIPANANPYQNEGDRVRFFIGYATERREWLARNRDNRGRGMPIGSPEGVGVPGK